MATSDSPFSSDMPFTLFNKDSKEYSLHDLNESNKTFLWHQFMLNVLLDIPRSLTSNKDITIACYHLKNENNMDNETELKESDIADFESNYTSDNAIEWYTRGSFLYRVFNKACRTLNSDAIIPFHPIVKDLTKQLKQLHQQQKNDGTFKFPMTVYRGQTTWGTGELEKIRANVDGLISMNTFLSTTTHCPVATTYASGTDRNTSVFFQITVKDSENLSKFQTFAHIDKDSKIQDEKEVLFSMSSVFKVISVEEDDCFWYINLELTNCENDKDMQRFTNEIRTYLYQTSGKQAPFIVFQQFFTAASLSQVKPFTEFVKYFLIEISQLFIINSYKKEGRMKTLIDMDSNLHAFAMKNNTDVIHSNEMSINLLFDLLNNFLYFDDKNVDEEVSFDKNDTKSLFCFAGFLLWSGDCEKTIPYLKMLLELDSINDKLKAYIHSMLGASYVMMKQKELALNSFDNAFQSFQSSTGQSTPPWLAASIASSHSVLHNSTQYKNQTLDELQILMKEEHSDDDVQEKLRLLHLGHICSVEQKFVDALNYWEEALEITSYLPSSIVTILNGAIYVQMAAAYLRINNMSKALSIMKIAMQYFECYYPSTHRMFANFNFMYGYYLIHNDQPFQAIQYLNKALENSYFSDNKDFIGIIYALLVMGYIQSGNIDRAEEYCHKALPYTTQNSITAAIPGFLEAIPELKMIIKYQNPNYGRKFVRTGLQLSQKLLSIIVPNSVPRLQSIDEQTCTMDELIAIADHYRHREDYNHAQIYYTKALDKTTEIDSKYLWNIFRKITKMNNHDQYRDEFALLYSKYDDNNSKDFQIISTIQIIMSKLFLSEKEFQDAFNCLIHGVFSQIKFIYHHNNLIDSNYISNMFHHFIHQEAIIKIVSVLTKLIQIYFDDRSTFLQDFLLKCFSFNDLYIELAKIIHHEQIHNFLNEIKSKSFSLFLHTLLQFVCRNIKPMEKSTVSLKDEILQFLKKYNDENAPLFYIMKIFESLLFSDTQAFFINLEQFQLNVITFENYEKLKEKFSNLFEQIQDDWLYKCLQNIAVNMTNQ